MRVQSNESGEIFVTNSTRYGRGPVQGHWIAGWVVLFLAVVAGGPSGAQSGNPRLARPHSHLGSPFQSPVFVTGHVAVGAGGVMESLQNGVGAMFLFRPCEADRFMDFLNGWNSSLVLQAEYHRVNSDQRILSGDMIIRRYIRDFTLTTPSKATFVGVGIGASEVTLVPPDGRGFEIGWEYVFEGGQEWNLRENFLIIR